MEIIRIPRIMQDTCRRHILKGRSVGFVPTMGALHEGHLSLMKRAQRENDSVVVSIFVNPAQFAPAEDFAAYPRDIDNDLVKLRDLGIDSLFVPDNSLMYPSGFSTSVEVGGLSDRLCGLYRPGHFRGVATVVAKLLNIVGPTRAYFGQKDFQQTVVIRRMVKDLNMDAEIVVCPTKREEDGLAMSSRNRYLNPQERTAAASLYRAMTLVSEDLRSGTKSPAALKEMLHAALAKEPLITGIDYAGIFHPETLDELQETGRLREVLIAVAARLGKTRLIDNIVVNLG
ncbi:MAG: pantoate--beta-alanine ligase [Nitrospiraceae bacterium]|nr:pantoate--beta-alanine ligase [Nitrospiraceae bacterium]